MILLNGCVRGIVGVLATPGITYIDIERVTVAVELPDGWYLHFVPSKVVEVGAEEVCWTGIGILYPVELPGSVQAHVAFRLCHIATLGRFG